LVLPADVLSELTQLPLLMNRVISFPQTMMTKIDCIMAVVGNRRKTKAATKANHSAEKMTMRKTKMKKTLSSLTKRIGSNRSNTNSRSTTIQNKSQIS
jgi:hypothetical protein